MEETYPGVPTAGTTTGNLAASRACAGVQVQKRALGGPDPIWLVSLWREANGNTDTQGRRPQAKTGRSPGTGAEARGLLPACWPRWPDPLGPANTSRRLLQL